MMFIKYEVYPSGFHCLTYIDDSGFRRRAVFSQDDAEKLDAAMEAVFRD